MRMNRIEIDSKLKAIFLKRFGLDFGAMGSTAPDWFRTDMAPIKEEFGDKKLLGREFGMPPRDLLYLFFDIEKEFGISIPQESIASGEFSTYNGICRMIEKELMGEPA